MCQGCRYTSPRAVLVTAGSNPILKTSCEDLVTILLSNVMTLSRDLI